MRASVSENDCLNSNNRIDEVILFVLFPAPAVQITDPTVVSSFLQKIILCYTRSYTVKP